MSLIELKLLIWALVGIDFIIVVLFIYLIVRFKNINNNKSLDSALKMLESLLIDADKITAEFKEQIAEKQGFLRQLNEQLDKKITGANHLLERVDSHTYSRGTDQSAHDSENYFVKDKQKEIVRMAEKGRKVEEIANSLSLPIEEVKLVLDLNKKAPQLGK